MSDLHPPAGGHFACRRRTTAVSGATRVGTACQHGVRVEGRPTIGAKTAGTLRTIELCNHAFLEQTRRMLRTHRQFRNFCSTATVLIFPGSAAGQERPLSSATSTERWTLAKDFRRSFKTVSARNRDSLQRGFETVTKERSCLDLRRLLVLFSPSFRAVGGGFGPDSRGRQDPPFQKRGGQD